MTDQQVRFQWARPVAEGRSDNLDEVRRIFGLSNGAESDVPVLDDVPLQSNGLTYVTGFSGAGKSKLLEMAREVWPDLQPLLVPPSDVPLIDALGLDLSSAMGLLGSVGLGEVFQFLTPFDRLSDGQQARACLAYTFAKGGRALVIDEFLSTVDRVTAKAAAYSFQRFCRSHGISAIVATAHDDLRDALGPDHIITLDFNGRYEAGTGRSARAPFQSEITIRPGSLVELADLERFHYMGPLGAMDDAYDLSIVVAECRSSVVGVAVFMAPYPRAWESIPVFADLNARVRNLVRVIVHPSFRGIGLTRRLASPVHVGSCAVYLRSALAIYQPFVSRLGYDEVEVWEQDLAQTLARDGVPSTESELRRRAALLLHEEFLNYRRLLSTAEWSDRDRSAHSGYHRIWESLVARSPRQQLIDQVTPFAMAGFFSSGTP